MINAIDLVNGLLHKMWSVLTLIDGDKCLLLTMLGMKIWFQYLFQI